MADLATILDPLVESQAQKTAAINEGFDAMSPAALFGRRAVTSAALTWGYFGGVFVKSDGTLATVANGTLTLPPSSTVYVEVDGTGTVSQNTTGFTAGRLPLYVLTTGTSSVTDYIDRRSGSQGNFRAASGGAVTSVAGRSGAVTLTHSDIGDWNEALDDRVAALLTATGLTLTYDDAGNLLNIALPTQPVAFPMFIPGTMSNDQLVFATIPAFALTIPAGLSGTTVRKTANPGSTVTITLKKNGVAFGTIDIASSGTVTLTSASGASFNGTSDELTVTGPATADTSLTNLGITLKGTR